MTKYIILGILQGITEFFPISSSGHMLILAKFLNIENILAYIIISHLGTLLALTIFFFKDILRFITKSESLFKVALATLLTYLLAVVLLENLFDLESVFKSSKLVGLSFIINGILLLLTKNRNTARKNMNIKDVVLFGITQGIAVFPGISRSGITISTLILRNVDKLVAFRFSFYASLPAVLGASLLEAKKTGFINLEFRFALLSFIFSFLSGIISLYFLKKIVSSIKFYTFGYYCIILGLLVLLF